MSDPQLEAIPMAAALFGKEVRQGLSGSICENDKATLHALNQSEWPLSLLAGQPRESGDGLGALTLPGWFAEVSRRYAVRGGRRAFARRHSG